MLSAAPILAMVELPNRHEVGEAFCSRPTGGHSEEDCMSDALSFVEIDDLHVELLPARTVMSMFRAGGGGGDGGAGGAGGTGQGGVGVNLLNINVLGTQGNAAGNGVGGDGGSANGGRG
jgi:hypothetical protein